MSSHNCTGIVRLGTSETVQPLDEVHLITRETAHRFLHGAEGVLFAYILPHSPMLLPPVKYSWTQSVFSQ